MKTKNGVRLRDRELFRMEGNCMGWVVFCRAGALWLTREGDLSDHLIRAGEEFATIGKGLILISALEDSEFEIG